MLTRSTAMLPKARVKRSTAVAMALLRHGAGTGIEAPLVNQQRWVCLLGGARPSVLTDKPWPIVHSPTLQRRFASEKASPKSDSYTTGGAVETLTIDAVWNLWNEGNLFSMNVPQIHAFLAAQNVSYDQNSKKAALIRQVEEFLQKRDGAQRGGDSGGQRGQGGRWQDRGRGGAVQPETLLDLQAAGFYENSASMAPKAFQILVSNHSPDLVVNRVNTTNFPGFPSSTECYTLSSALTDLAVRARFTKALSWCYMNVRNLGLSGEFIVDFGKLVLKEKPMLHPRKKHLRLVSAWSLQQRAQLNDPYTWVSHISENALPDLEEHLKKEEFVSVAENHPGFSSHPRHYFEVHIRRKADSLILELEINEGNFLNGYDSCYPIQQSHMLSQTGGQDVRLRLVTKNPLKPQDSDIFKKCKILNITEESVTSALPPELGQVVYVSENKTELWERTKPAVRGRPGSQHLVKRVRRTPLIATREDEEDDRLECHLISTLTPGDMTPFANELYDRSRRMAAVLTPHFLSEFATETAPVSMDTD